MTSVISPSLDQVIAWPLATTHVSPPLGDVTVMRGGVALAAPGVDALPHRHVDQDAVVIERSDVGGGAPRFVGKAPHEAGACVGEGVDFRELVHEVGHDRIVERRAHPRDIDLGYVEASLAHGVHRGARSRPRLERSQGLGTVLM